MQMRAAWLALSFGLAFIAADSPRFSPVEKTSIQKVLATDIEAESVEMKVSLDGQDLPKSALGDMSISFHERRKVTVTDRYMKVGDGRPLELDRVYDELVQTTHDTKKMPGMTAEEATDKSEVSDLEGATVRFSWKADKKKYETTFGGKDLDAKLLAGLGADLDFQKFVPTDTVKVGDSWDLDADAFAAMLSAGGDLHFHEEGKPEKVKKEGSSDEQFEDNLAGTGKATFENVREKDGRRLAHIVIEGKLETHANEEGGFEGQLALDVEGQVLWDLDANRVDSVALESKVDLHMIADQKIEKGGESRTMHLEFHLEGKSHLDVSTKAP